MEFKVGDWVKCRKFGKVGQLQSNKKDHQYPLKLPSDDKDRAIRTYTSKGIHDRTVDTEPQLEHLTPLELAML